jgi:AraC-like DNA-binding protein
MDLQALERPSDSPFIERIWAYSSDEPLHFLSMAGIHSELVVTRQKSRTRFTIRGPETHATPAAGPGEASYIGIQFKPGVFMPAFPPGTISDRRDIDLPTPSASAFWLDGTAWELPTFDNADEFVARLARAGTLAYEPLVGQVMQSKPFDLSLRTVQRRFVQATGLSYAAVYQIVRARYAARLLRDGEPILDTVEAAGYFDQPHLTRALKYRIGLTPAQIQEKNRAARVSFLYNTSQTDHAILSVQGQIHTNT